MEQKAPVTIEGLNQIRLIKKGLNRGRVSPVASAYKLKLRILAPYLALA